MIKADKRYMPMVPIKYQVVGEEDHAFAVKINSNGEYEVNSGTYKSQSPLTVGLEGGSDIFVLGRCAGGGCQA